MQEIIDIIAHLESITDDDMEEMILEVMKRNEDIAITLNWEQLGYGLDAYGKVVGRYASKAYEKYKRGLNPLARGRVDLRLSGSFWINFYLDTSEFPAEIRSGDSKAATIEEKYSTNIYGLTEKNFAKFLAAIQIEIAVGYQRLLQL